jgi:twitching motility two-component system response regulator PilG
MYGNLQEIDVNSLFTFISREQKSGILFLETDSYFSVKKICYFIFFNNGDIIFAGDEKSFNLQRLQEYLHYYKLSDKIQTIEEKLILSMNIAEYEAILLLSQQKIISINQEKNLFKKIVEEILFTVITLTKGNFTWQENFNLSPLIIRFKIDSLLPKIMTYAQNWHKLNPYIKYPQQYPIITDNLQLKSLVSDHLYITLCEKIDGKTSFLQLSRYLHQNLATIGQIIYPYIEMGWIKIITPLLLSSIYQYSLPKTYKIICLTQDNHWALKTRKLLDLSKYNFFSYNSFIQILNHLLTSSTDLIILDSEINNNEQYQLCKIVRQTANLKDIPIIFIVKKYIYKNSLIAKIHGATEYINKKNFNQNLLHILDKYL